MLIPAKLADEIQSVDYLLEESGPVPEIREYLNQTVLLGGKRFRPALCFAMGRLFGVSAAELSPFACSIERVHAATLAHDDVIDGASLRRSRPTLNALASNSRAVLAGDLLLARVITVMAETGKPEHMLSLSHVLAELIEGEWLQLEARGQTRITRRHLETVASKKTASVLRWCCGTPARITQEADSVIHLAEQFGEHLGVAFQMIDDAIDYSESSGKPYAQDFCEGLVNFVTLEILEAHPERLAQVQEKLGVAKERENFPWTEAEIQVALASVRRRAETKLVAAREILRELALIIGKRDPLFSSARVSSLEMIIDECLQRSR